MASKESDDEKSLRLQINFLTRLIKNHKQKELTSTQNAFKYVNPRSSHRFQKFSGYSNPQLYKLDHLHKDTQKIDSTKNLKHYFVKNFQHKNVTNPYEMKKNHPVNLSPASIDKQKSHVSQNPYSLVNTGKIEKTSNLLLNKQCSESPRTLITASQPSTSQTYCQSLGKKPLKQLSRYKLVKCTPTSDRKPNLLIKNKTALQPCVNSTTRVGHFIIRQSTGTSPRLVKLSRHRMVRLNMPSKVVRKVNRYKLEQKITILPLNANTTTLRKNPKTDLIFKKPCVTNTRSSILHSNYVINRIKKTPERKFCSSNESAPKMMVIGGLLYKCSRNKLSRTNQAIRSKKCPQVIVKNWNHKKAKIIKVRGIKFEVDPSGHNLRKISTLGSDNASRTNSSNLSRVDIGGVTYIEKQPGVFQKSSIGYTRTLANRVLLRSINCVQATKLKKSQQFCMFFNRFGKCNKQSQCPYIHDPEKIAVCKRFLKGSCHQENCPFSHKIAKEKMPVCSFFMRGICNKDNCPYLHSNAGPGAAVCKDFLKGYCSQGEKCKKRHVLVCEEFEKTGKCKHGKRCPLAFQEAKKRKKNKADIIPISRNIVPITEAVTNNILNTQDDVSSHLEGNCLKKLPSFISLSDNLVEEVKKPNTLNSEEPKKVLKIRPQIFEVVKKN